MKKRPLKFVIGQPLNRRTLHVSRLESFNCRKLFSRTSAAALVGERRGLNFHRFNFTYSSAAAFIPVALSVAALIFCNFPFMSVAALITSVPSAAAFSLFSDSFDRLLRFFTFLTPFLLHLQIPYKSKQTLIKT